MHDKRYIKIDIANYNSVLKVNRPKKIYDLAIDINQTKLDHSNEQCEHTFQNSETTNQHKPLRSNKFRCQLFK